MPDNTFDAQAAYQQLLQKQMQTMQQQEQGLTDRLNTIEQYNQQVTPGIRQSLTDFSDRPVGANPLDAIQQVVEMGESARGYRTAAREDLSSLSAQRTGLMGQLAQLAEREQEQKASEPKIDPITGEIDYSEVDEDTALEIVNKTGRRLLSGGLGEKKAQAKAILSYGSVDKYLKEAPLDDIYSLKAFKDEAENDEKAYDLLRRVDSALQYFPKGSGVDLFGEGNISGPLAGNFLGIRPKTRKARSQARAAIGELSAEKIKELSGAAVSDTEFERLTTFLPDKGMQEDEVASKLDSLKRAVEMNLEAREDAVRSGQSVSSYWKNNKDKYLNKYGFSKTTGSTTAPTYDEDKLLNDLGI